MDSTNNEGSLKSWSGDLEFQKLMENYDAATGVLTIGDDSYEIKLVNADGKRESLAGENLNAETVRKICQVAKQLLGELKKGLAEDQKGAEIDKVKFTHNGQIKYKVAGDEEWKEVKVGVAQNEIAGRVGELCAILAPPKRKKNEEKALQNQPIDNTDKSYPDVQEE